MGFFCELEIGKVFLKWCYIAIDAKLPVESTAFFSFYYGKQLWYFSHIL